MLFLGRLAVFTCIHAKSVQLHSLLRSTPTGLFPAFTILVDSGSTDHMLLWMEAPSIMVSPSFYLFFMVTFSKPPTSQHIMGFCLKGGTKNNNKVTANRTKYVHSSSYGYTSDQTSNSKISIINLHNACSVFHRVLTIVF